jgi:hypothetical protein
MSLCRLSFVCGWGNRPLGVMTPPTRPFLCSISTSCSVKSYTVAIYFYCFFFWGSLSIIEINKGNRLNVCCLSHTQMLLHEKTRLSVQDVVLERRMFWVHS